MHPTRGLLIASLFAAAVAHGATDIHRTFNVAPGGTLTLDTDAGDVRVEPGAAGVTVDVKRTRNLNVTFAQSGNDVTVSAKDEGPISWFHWNSDDARFIVTVPSAYNVRVSTSGGEVHVGDIRGAIRVHTSGGSLEVGNVTGPVDARTSGGSINVGRVEGEVHAHTSGGSITIGDAAGTIDAETSGGSIHARLSRAPRTDSKLSTSGGSISVSIANNIALDVDARSSGGGVESDVPVTIQGRQDDDSLLGKINGGGPRLVLRSSGGGIHIKRL